LLVIILLTVKLSLTVVGLLNVIALLFAEKLSVVIWLAVILPATVKFELLRISTALSIYVLTPIVTFELLLLSIITPLALKMLFTVKLLLIEVVRVLLLYVIAYKGESRFLIAC